MTQERTNHFEIHPKVVRSNIDYKIITYTTCFLYTFVFAYNNKTFALIIQGSYINVHQTFHRVKATFSTVCYSGFRKLNLTFKNKTTHHSVWLMFASISFDLVKGIMSNFEPVHMKQTLSGSLLSSPLTSISLSAVTFP